VTGATIGGGGDLSVLLDGEAHFALLIRRKNVHRRYAIRGAQLVFRRTMAVEAPAHGHRLGHVHLPHRVDSPMTTDASDVAVHMDRVIEEHEVGQAGNSLPLEWLIAEIAAPNSGQQGSLIPDLSVTVHAYVAGRHTCIRRPVDGAMTVTAIDPIIECVMAVIEENRLGPRL